MSEAHSRALVPRDGVPNRAIFQGGARRTACGSVIMNVCHSAGVRASASPPLVGTAVSNHCGGACCELQDTGHQSLIAVMTRGSSLAEIYWPMGDH